MQSCWRSPIHNKNGTSFLPPSNFFGNYVAMGGEFYFRNDATDPNYTPHQQWHTRIHIYHRQDFNYPPAAKEVFFDPILSSSYSGIGAASNLQNLYWNMNPQYWNGQIGGSKIATVEWNGRYWEGVSTYWPGESVSTPYYIRLYWVKTGGLNADNFSGYLQDVPMGIYDSGYNINIGRTKVGVNQYVNTAKQYLGVPAGEISALGAALPSQYAYTVASTNYYNNHISCNKHQFGMVMKVSPTPDFSVYYTQITFPTIHSTDPDEAALRHEYGRLQYPEYMYEYDIHSNSQNTTVVSTVRDQTLKYIANEIKLLTITYAPHGPETVQLKVTPLSGGAITSPDINIFDMNSYTNGAATANAYMRNILDTMGVNIPGVGHVSPTAGIGSWFSDIEECPLVNNPNGASVTAPTQNASGEYGVWTASAALFNGMDFDISGGTVLSHDTEPWLIFVNGVFTQYGLVHRIKFKGRRRTDIIHLTQTNTVNKQGSKPLSLIIGKYRNGTYGMQPAYIDVYGTLVTNGSSLTLTPDTVTYNPYGGFPLSTTSPNTYYITCGSDANFEVVADDSSAPDWQASVSNYQDYSVQELGYFANSGLYAGLPKVLHDYVDNYSITINGSQLHTVPFYTMNPGSNSYVLDPSEFPVGAKYYGPFFFPDINGTHAFSRRPRGSSFAVPWFFDVSRSLEFGPSLTDPYSTLSISLNIGGIVCNGIERHNLNGNTYDSSTYTCGNSYYLLQGTSTLINYGIGDPNNISLSLPDEWASNYWGRAIDRVYSLYDPRGIDTFGTISSYRISTQWRWKDPYRYEYDHGGNRSIDPGEFASLAPTSLSINYVSWD